MFLPSSYANLRMSFVRYYASIERERKREEGDGGKRELKIQREREKEGGKEKEREGGKTRDEFPLESTLYRRQYARFATTDARARACAIFTDTATRSSPISGVNCQVEVPVYPHTRPSLLSSRPLFPIDLLRFALPLPLLTSVS